jgi:hypothetical protein
MKNSSSPFTRSLDNSFVTDNTDINYPCDVPMLNVAFSGKMDSGFQSGITIWGGPSKHFKSMYALKMLDTWFLENPDGVCLFFDSEYGITEDYINQYPNINMARVLHTPVTTIEELRHEATKQVENLYETYKVDYKKAPKSTERPKVFVLVDSIGQLASNKETEDAKDGKTTVDMTRAKAVKSFFRILTSKVKMLGIPMAVVAHTYQTLEMFSKAVVSGGCVAAGTKICMADGSTKNIEDMSPGDLVKTKEGDRPVTHIWNPDTLDEGHPESYDVEFEDGSVVRMSYKHKLSLNGEWVEAQNFEVGMDLDLVS